MNDTIERLARCIAGDLEMAERAYLQKRMDKMAVYLSSAQSFANQLLEEIEYQKYQNRISA